MNIPILMYHQIDEPPPRGTPLRGLTVSPTSFSRQMRWLRWLGFRGLSLQDLEPYLNGRKQGKVVGITLDDGYQNNLHHALPALIKNGFTATCYGVSAMMGQTNSWDQHIGVPTKPLMSIQEWQQWTQAGMEAGSHTRTHANLTELTDEEALDQIVRSKSELEAITQREVRHFCYPYGKFHPRHTEMVRNAGYLTATTTQRGRVQPDSDMYNLQRIMVAQATHLGLFTAKVLTGYEDKRA